MKKINVQGLEIAIVSKREQDYISLTDMLRAKDGEFFISDWLRNRNTIEFLGIWEQVNNPNFNYGEFAIIRSRAGLNSYKISVKDWVNKTGAIGLGATTGRYGGTFAHKDIAFEFGMWISPEFKIYLIKEFQRLKIEENTRLTLGWDAKRTLTKINYRIHTDSIKENIILPQQLSQKDANNTYATEADILNKALFGMTALEWKSKNKNKEGNMRDYSDVCQLICLANLETLNSEFIKMGMSQKERLLKLNEIAITQMKSLLANNTVKKLLK
ncbi:MAG: KilA-N domain-containing protein [Patescibacteria group bacterium]